MQNRAIFYRKLSTFLEGDIPSCLIENLGRGDWGDRGLPLLVFPDQKSLNFLLFKKISKTPLTPVTPLLRDFLF